uniref:Nucleoporin Nup54 alpha-helical domain-containing protein n=1 Tax=Tetradesmus obliquus TaxID=3088 RepID=A0A383WBX5_TETOB|eukprot:jgi/Sobl393_1/15250/SZX75118.1
MAFSFGASSTPAFGASSAPAFGASSAPAFGAPASSASGFSFGSSPAFGTPSSTSAFGAPSSSTPAFGASSTPAFGAATSSAPPFGAATSTPAFGAASSTPSFSFSSAPAFGQTAAQTAVAPFGAFGQQQQQQQAQQQQAFTHATKFDDLDQATKDKLTQIQDQISKYEADRQRVMHAEHLQDNTALQQGLDADTSSLSAELRQLQASIKAEQEGLADFREKAIRLLKSTETVVRTYERTKLWRDAPAMYQRQEALKPAQQELLHQPVVLPGPFLEEAVAGFSSNCAEYSRCLEEVEQVLAASSLQETPAGDVNWVMALPTVVSNMHDYFVATAAKLERTHTEVQKAKAAYLARLRARGITVDPFERAHRQEQQLQLQQQQRTAAALGQGGHGQLAALPAPAAAAAGGVTGAIVPAAAGSPAAGGLFGQASPATPAAGFGTASFGSPFVSTATPAPFGGAAANNSLSRSTSKGRSGKKR